MVTTIIIIGVALAWLAWESDWFTIRLPYGKALQSNSSGIKMKGNNISLPATDSPYYWRTPEDKEKHLRLCVGCRLKCQEHKTERWAGWTLPARTIKAFNSTLNLNEGCNIWRAMFLKQVANANKPRKVSFTPCQLPLDAFIKTVRIGSHNEWIATDDKGHGYHRIVEEYTTHYNDCLIGKGWLKEHEHDKYPEPTIELTVDGGQALSLNGNYNKGKIKTFMANYCRPGEGKIRLVKVR